MNSLLLFFLLLLLLLLPSSTPVSATCPSAEASSLLKLRTSFSFNLSQSPLSSWLPNIDCCRWPRVTCAGGAHVTSLDLSSLRLSLSTTPFDSPSLRHLTQLKSLNLAFNSFNSSIPPNLDQLQNLTHLNLSNSGFSGQIPLQISRIPTLVSLDLSASSPTLSSAPLNLKNPDLKTFLANLANLQELYLDGVNISSQGSQWCDVLADSLPKVRILSLSNCFITGPLQPSLLKLTQLAFLRVAYNNISSRVPPFLSNLPLTSLVLTSCQLIGEFPSEIFLMPALKKLDVSINRGLGGGLPEFPDNSSLEELLLSDTKFSGSLPPSIGKLSLLSKLQLKNASFSGDFPDVIGKLTRLVYLDLSLNSFTGKIPPLDKLTQLIHLDLSENSLSGWKPDFGHRLVEVNLGNNLLKGSIPSSLFSLPSLQTLLLNQNQLEGRITEFADAHSSPIKTIDLSNNKLQGGIPKSIFQIAGLNVLKLSSNNFTGTVNLTWLESLHNLSTLELSDNQLLVEDTVTNGSNFPQIGRLKLASCNLTKVPEILKYQEKLNVLDLSNNAIRGEIPNWIWSLKHLMQLNLSINRLTGLQQPALNPALSSLSVLDLHSNLLQGPLPFPSNSSIILDYSDNRFKSAIPSNIGELLPFTIFFSLSSNHLIGEIPESICKASFLKVLDLSNNHLSGPIPPCLSNASASLIVLNLRANSFSGTIPTDFSDKCNLRTLDLNGNLLGGQVPKSLQSCGSLEVLNLGNNMINDTAPQWIGNMPNLRVLVLRGNSFHGQINCHSNHFKMLRILDLSSNKFSGNLPPNCFENLKAMIAGNNSTELDMPHPAIGVKLLHWTPLYYQDMVNVTSKGMELELVKILTIFSSLDLSNNRFSGSIPDTIGQLSLLYGLNLSNNALVGSIPSSIGSLLQLESLDLSRNNLSGEIPPELTELTFLAVLNLSNNHLVGRIPRGFQFNTFSSSSYGGNSGLYGPPLKDNRQFAPAPKGVQLHSQSIHEFEWGFIIIGLGFGWGMAITVVPIMMWRKGRRWYNKNVDRLLNIFLSRLFVYFDLEGDRIEAEENVDQELTESTLEEDNEMCRRRFCVFCTELDPRGARVIHRECSCNTSPPFSS